MTVFGKDLLGNLQADFEMYGANVQVVQIGQDVFWATSSAQTGWAWTRLKKFDYRDYWQAKTGKDALDESSFQQMIEQFIQDPRGEDPL